MIMVYTISTAKDNKFSGLDDVAVAMVVIFLSSLSWGFIIIKLLTVIAGSKDDEV